MPLGRELVFTAKDVRVAFEDTLERAGGSLGIWIVLNAISDEGFVSQSILASRAHVVVLVDRQPRLRLEGRPHGVRGDLSAR